MKFSRIVFGIAAAYGFLVLLPLYFLLGRVGRDAPPPVTHPEFYYGFVGLALLWQIVFVLIARDPTRYRPVMLIAILEKFIYTVPVVLLYLQGQVHPKILVPSLVDPVFGVFFILAYFRTPKFANPSE
jgi:hypothetical protein